MIWLHDALETALSISINGTCGPVAMTSASHDEGRQLDPGQVYGISGIAIEDAKWGASTRSFTAKKTKEGRKEGRMEKHKDNKHPKMQHGAQGVKKREVADFSQICSASPRIQKHLQR